MSKTRIYGGSDDLIEIEGEIEDEIECYDHKKPIPILGSDGTKATIFYDGEWKINVSFAGSLYLRKIDSVGEDKEHTEREAIRCTSYSDVLVFEPGLQWIQVRSKIYKR